MAEDDEHEVLHEADSSMSFAQMLSQLETGNDHEIRKRLQSQRLFVGETGPSRVVGHSTVVEGRPG
jgi:hypothetical protein